MYSNWGHDTPKQGSFKVPTLQEIREERKKRTIITIACIYGDDVENGLHAVCDDSKNARTLAFAGVVGIQEEWDVIRPAWLDCTKGKEFHGSNCETGHKDYENIPLQERLDEYRKLTTILADESTLCGFGVALDIAAFKSNLPKAKKEAPYFSCFMRVVMGLAEVGYLSIPRQKVEFAFDINIYRQYNSARMLEVLSRWPDCKWAQYIITDRMRYLSHKEFEMQVACLLAREPFKYLDNILTGEGRNIRASTQKLLSTGRFRFHTYERGYFEDISQFMKDHADEFNKEDSAYRQWLKDKGIKVDNITNQIYWLLTVFPPKPIEP